MTYNTNGKDTLDVEVTNVSKHGFWLLIHDEEFFLSFDTFPWFREAPVGKLVHVELVSAEHLYWPDLDVDLELESILHPERFPLTTAAVHETGEAYETHRDTPQLDKDKIE